MIQRQPPLSPPVGTPLSPPVLRAQHPSEVTQLVRVQLPSGGLPLSGVDEAVNALKKLPLDAEGQAALDNLKQVTVTIPSLGALSGLVLTHFEYGTGVSGSLFVALAWPTARWDLFPGFSVASPSLAFALRAGSEEISVGGELTIGTLTLLADVMLPELEIRAELLAPALFGELLEVLQLDGSSLDDLELTRLVMSAAVRERRLRFGASIGGDWYPFGEGRGPALRSLDFDIDWDRDANSVQASFGAQLVLGPVLFKASATSVAGGWLIAASISAADEDAPLSLSALVCEIVAAFSLTEAVDLPWSLDLNEVGLTLSTVSGAFLAYCEVETEGVALALRVAVERDAAGARAVKIGGSMRVDGLVFDVVYREGSFLASFSDTTGHEVDLASLLRGLLELMGAQVPEFPAVTLRVREVLVVALANPGPPPAQGTVPPKRRTLVHIDLDLGFNVGALPVVGDVFGEDFELKIRFAPRYASVALTENDVRAANTLLPPHLKRLPVRPIQPGMDFDAEISLGGMSFALPLGMGMSDASAVPVPVKSALAPKDGKSWIELDQTIGPLSLKRIGVGFTHADKNGTALPEPFVTLVLDGGVALGPVQAATVGLGVKFGIKSRKVTPQLDGLAIAVQAGTVSIVGAFLRTISTNPDLGDCYAGMIRVIVGDLQISAMGLYQEAFGGPTLFIYGYAGYSVGLRPVISVDGVALGFGYGRKLLPVSATEIEFFPLVQEVIAPFPPKSVTGSVENTAMNALEKLRLLQYWLPPSRGGLVFAFGIKAGLFEGLIDAFLLATVSFNIEDPTDLMVQVCGSGTATLPPNSPGPWALYIKLDIAASYQPLKGELAISAALDRRSFVLDQRAMLTGGFAFSLWTPPSPHAGDFVLTLGGYPTSFQKPAHYPVAPRLGLHWQVNDQLLVKGEFYAALTPSAFMAGGRLEADFRAGKLHAWFKVWMDVAIRWKPFHYDFVAGVEIGASFGALGISAHADVHIWGPEFSGHANVKLTVVLIAISFDVDFGAAAAPPPPLAWDQFRDSFLPPKDQICVPAVGGGVLDVIEGGRLATTARKGSDNKVWVVASNTVSLTVTTSVPWSSGAIHLEPMAATLTASRPTVKLYGTGSALLATWDGTSGTFGTFGCEILAKPFPPALWKSEGPPLYGALRFTAPAATASPSSGAIPEATLGSTDYAVQHQPGAAGSRGTVASLATGDGVSVERIDAALSAAAVRRRRGDALASLGLDTRELAIRDHWGRVGLTAAPRIERRLR